ncbi:single-stranded DNA-binding protein [Dellaglioa algida]|nr:single-stranded DNA-binding protein [Dellaglioa algida]
MINSTVLVGRLTRDLDLRYTASGAAVASFTLAVNRQFTNANGEREADFISCVAWRKAAENLANFTHKGSLIGITGNIQTRSYDNSAGTRIYVTEIVVGSFSLLESQKSQNHEQSDQRNNQSVQQNNQTNTDLQNNTQQTSNNQNKRAPQQGNAAGGFNDSPDPFSNKGQEIDISDDDLPF